MQLENSFVVPIPKAHAWRLLLDIERIASCMPGAALDSVDGDTFHGRVKVKLGAVPVAYQGTGTFVEKDEPSGKVTLSVSGSEVRGSGTASAIVTATLTDRGETTMVRVSADLAIGGKGAQFGRGIMTEVADRLISQFATQLSELIETSAAPTRAEPLPAGALTASSGTMNLGSVALPAVARWPLPAATVILFALVVALRRRKRR